MMTDNLALSNGTTGRAVETVSGPGVNTLTIDSCLLQRSNDAAISTADTTLVMSRTAVRDTLPIAGNDSSFGVGVALYQTTFTISQSTVERAHTSAVELVQSKGSIVNSTVKDTLSIGDPQIVYTGIRAVSSNSNPTELTLKSSTISGTPQVAIMVYKSTATIEGALVYNNMVDLAHARGAPVLADTGTITMRYSVLTENWGGGLLIRRGSGLLDSSVVKDVQLELGFGPCAAVIRLPNEVPADLKVSASLLEGCSQVGAVSYQGNLTVENSLVHDVFPSVEGFGGDAISVVNEKMPDGALTVRSTLVDEATRAGISSFGASATVEKSAILCTKFGIVAEPLDMYTANVALPEDSLCGCDDAMGACTVETAGIEVSADLY
ncbi:MAG: right-handed parallel beta-helix repeat-containing protein [Polyangiaceae bacterium]|nr:right-handed parallel beta-helix repeat-containing protein [Polyangiaceae bacterium]